MDGVWIFGTHPKAESGNQHLNVFAIKVAEDVFQQFLAAAQRPSSSVPLDNLGTSEYLKGWAIHVVLVVYDSRIGIRTFAVENHVPAPAAFISQSSHFPPSRFEVRPGDRHLWQSSWVIARKKCLTLLLRFEEEVSMNKEMKFLAKFGLGVLAVFGWFLGGVVSSSTGMKKSKR